MLNYRTIAPAIQPRDANQNQWDTILYPVKCLKKEKLEERGKEKRRELGKQGERRKKRR